MRPVCRLLWASFLVVPIRAYASPHDLEEDEPWKRLPTADSLADLDTPPPPPLPARKTSKAPVEIQPPGPSQLDLLQGQVVQIQQELVALHAALFPPPLPPPLDATPCALPASIVR